jgi:putative aldouronate transport system substrate-binding protein
MQKLTRRSMLQLMGMTTIGAALAACAPAAPAGAGEGAAPGSEPVRITMVESWFGLPQFKESIDPVMEAINQKMQSEGLNIEIVSLILEDHEAKYPALYASGSDFTMAFDAPWYKMNTLRDQGALAPLETLIDEHGPQLKEAITEKIYNANFMAGHLYGIPAAFYYGGTRGIMFREDLRKKYGAEMPTSEGGWASAESFLAAILENEPQMIPYVNIPTQSMITANSGRRAWSPGATKTGIMIPDATTDWQFIDEETFEPQLEMAHLLRSWWEKGYINKTDMPSTGTSQNSQVDYVYPGRAASCIENEPEYKFVDQTKQLKATIPEGELMGVDMTGMRTGDVKPLGNLKQWNFVVFNVNAPEAQHVAGIQYFNWLASSQDNLDLWLMGIDGVNYKKEENMRFSEVEGTRNYRRQWYVSGMSGRFQRQPADLPPEAEAALQFFTTEDNWVFNPYEGFEVDTKAVELEVAKLNAVYDEAAHGLQSGQMPVEEAVARMKQMLDDAGRQEYKAKIQAQLDEYIKANPA